MLRRTLILAVICSWGLACGSHAGQADVGPDDGVPDSGTSEGCCRFCNCPTLSILVGDEPRSPPDDYARLTATHFGTFLPNALTVRVENRPDQGAMDVANVIYRDGTPDGLTIATFPAHLLLQAAIGHPDARFEPEELLFVGAPARTIVTCGVMSRVGSTKWSNVAFREPGLRMGAIADPVSWETPTLLNALSGSTLQVVDGFANGTALLNAALAGEIDGWCQPLRDMRALTGNHLDAGDFVVFVTSLPEAELPDATPMKEVVTSSETRDALAAWTWPHAIAHPLILPPEVPTDVVDILREGYARMLVDPDFLADAEERSLPIDAMGGEEIQQRLDAALRLASGASDTLRVLLER